jgi:molecular chaperone HtpG
MSKKQEKIEFKAEMKQLLHLIINSLYIHPEIFVRELISNASDALNKVRFEQLTNNDVSNPELPLQIKIKLNKENQTFSIEDTGIGMTKDELISNIGTIANSGTLEFLEQCKQTKTQDVGQLIGHFGVGFYSIFMVTDEVELLTKSAASNSQAYKWISKGENDFTIEETEKEIRGTIISFKLKDEFKQFSEEYAVKNAINKFSNFVNFPIFINDTEVDRVVALWHKKKDDIKKEEVNEFYKFISNDYSNPVEHLLLNIEGNIEFKSILFIPETAPSAMFRDVGEKSLQLYVNRVFIQDDAKELLPEYLRFIKGVVETDDLPLNVSREFTQSSPVIQKIKNILVSKILAWLEDIATKEPTKYINIYKNYGSLFKTGLNSDFTNKDKIISLLRFETTKTKDNEYISFKDYTMRMKTEQKDIFYLFGSAKELLINNPNLEYFRKNDLEVILLTDPIDVFCIPYIYQYDEKNLISIEKAEIPTTENETKIEEETKDIISVFKEVLNDKIADVLESKRLVTSPVTLVVSRDGMDSQMEKVMQIIDKNFNTSKRILEVNLSHPLIVNIARLNKHADNGQQVQNVILQLFDSALLIEGQIKNPNEFVQRMIEFMTKATNE